MTDVEREIVLPASPNDVWEELTDPERLGEWFGADVDGDVAEGELVRFTTSDGERRAVVERADPPHRLTFRWLPTIDEPPSRVEIVIDEASDGSVVRVVERRIAAAVSPEPEIGFLARV
ncbi:MAG: SRPBCC domain-containing protein [Actinomycetota bacterium]